MYYSDSAGNLPVGKFGQNADIDTGTTPEDVWSAGGLIPYPASAAETTVVSDSADDDSGGVGVNTVIIDGVDGAGMRLVEEVTLDGITPVTLTNHFRCINRMAAGTPGSNGTNVGNIQAKHGATVLCEVPAGDGQSQTTGYTIPADWRHGYLESHYINVSKNTANVIVTAKLKVRSDGGSWRTLYPITLDTSRNQVDHAKEYRTPIEFHPLTAFRWEIDSVSSSNAVVQAGFDLVLSGKITE